MKKSLLFASLLAMSMMLTSCLSKIAEEVVESMDDESKTAALVETVNADANAATAEMPNK